MRMYKCLCTEGKKNDTQNVRNTLPLVSTETSIYSWIQNWNRHGFCPWYLDHLKKAIGSIPRWSRTFIWVSLQGMSIRLMIGVPQNSPLLHSLIDHQCLCWCTMKLPKLYPLATPRLAKPVSTVFSNLQLTGNFPIMAVLHSAGWLSTTYSSSTC